MVKRLISATASEIAAMDAHQLKQAIMASEGRVLLGETVVTSAPLLDGVTNAEVMAAFGIDMILLNEYDVFEKKIVGMEAVIDPIQQLKTWTGRPIGINLEPVDWTVTTLENRIELAAGRIASLDSIIEAQRQGIDFICLTGNPATGVSNNSIEAAIPLVKEQFAGLIFAGKMHAASVDEPVFTKEQFLRYLALGADGVMVPAVNTVPGVSEVAVYQAIEAVHAQGGLVISTIGTSQESADCDTIRQIGLVNKRVGADLHHIGDGSFGRMPEPENIIALSNCVRGKRHTYYRMSVSIKR